MIRDPETLKQLIDLVERFVRERLIPAENQLAEEGKLPEALLEEMKNMGLFGLTIPEEYGGLGLTMEEELLVSMALGHTSPAFRSILGTNIGIGSAAIVFAGTKEQKQKQLIHSPLAYIGRYFCFCSLVPANTMAADPIPIFVPKMERKAGEV